VSNRKPVIGILGAGKLGIVLAQLALKAGYSVLIVGSGEIEKIALSISILTPGATALIAVDVARQSDVIVLALPLSHYRQLPVHELQGKIVIDAMNYWWEVDGELHELIGAASSSEMVQAFLHDSLVVKAVSHMGYHHLLDYAMAAESHGRKGLAIASNYPAAMHTVADIVNNLGFDPVIVGPLSAGRLLEPGHALFGASISADEIRKTLAPEVITASE
jgi:predicted dinucleotide-binding enzyme